MDKTPTQWMIEPLRRYAQFSGRARRAEYWWFTLFGLIVAVAAFALDSALGLRPVSGRTGLIGGLTSLALFIPQLAVAIRRLHDVDRTGWWIVAPIALGVVLGVAAGAVRAGGGGGAAALILLVTVVLTVFVIVLLVWYCTRGTVGPNRFGPDPLAVDDGSTVALS